MPPAVLQSAIASTAIAYTWQKE